MAIFCICTAVSPVSADNARATFESVYGNQLEQVKSTRDRSDDTTLARMLIDSAKQAASTPALAAVLCNEAYELTRLHEPAVALDAMRLLKQASPTDRKVASENIIRLLTIQMRASDASVRDTAANELITLHTEAGDAAFNANDLREATAAYRRALVLASRQKHASMQSLREKIKATADRARTLREVEQLEQKILGDSNDQEALTELILTYLFDFRQPSKASAYVSRVKDAALKSNLELAMPSDTSLNADSCLKLGQWCVDMGEKSAGSRAAGARSLASSVLKRFLLLHTAMDIKRTRGQLLLKQVEIELSKAPQPIKPAGAASTDYQPPSGMMSIIELSFDDVETKSTLADTPAPRRVWNVSGPIRVRGRLGGARWFDGKDDYIIAELRTMPQTFQKRIVVSAWIKPEASDGVIFGVGGQTHGMALHVAGGYLRFSVQLTGERRVVTSAIRFQRDWNHVVVDYQLDGSVTLVVNGKVSKGKVGSALQARPGEPWTIGADKGSTDVGDYGGEEYFKGSIDDFRVWFSK